MNYFQSWTHTRSQAEADVDNCFEDQKNRLFDEKFQKSYEVDQWENEVIRQIRENTMKQKQFLEDAYGHQLRQLDNKRREFLETLLVYEQQQDSTKIYQLKNQCRALKFQLAAFEYPERNIPFIQLTKMEQAMEVKRDERNAHRTDDDYKSNATNYPDVYDSSLSKSTSSGTQQTNQSTGTTDATKAHDHTLINNYYSDVTNSNTALDKCPTCYMIFPSYMTTSERSVHINEHFKDA